MCFVVLFFGAGMDRLCVVLVFCCVVCFCEGNLEKGLVLFLGFDLQG